MNAVPSPRDAGRFMGRHTRTFRFATLVMQPRLRGRIERVYAWCRYTDDIVDRATDPAAAAAELERWLLQSRAAYDGQATGLALLDEVMRELRESGGSFEHAEAVVRGVRSDLRFSPFATSGALRQYTSDVASAVGLWLCALHDVRDPWMLSRAAELGHAMQLTNILRDVGDDLEQGRLYLPLDALARHGLGLEDIQSMKAGSRPIAAAWRDLMEELIAEADHSYRLAAEAIPQLPYGFAPAVAIAAVTYAAIHDAIRRNGYDNLSLRASTSVWTKVSLGGGALRELHRRRRRGEAILTGTLLARPPVGASASDQAAAL